MPDTLNLHGFHAGTPSENDPFGLAGKTLAGVYVVTAYLASGGMAVVYRARDVAAGRDCVIKFLWPRSAQTGSDAELRFQREYEIGRALGAPGLVEMYAFHPAARHPAFIAMEHLEGWTLKRRLVDDTIDARELFAVAKKVLATLAALHEAGIVHRDVKPDNIFLCDGGAVKLLDLGIAHAAGVSPQLTLSHSIIGTPYYMAPELVFRPKAIDGRVDVYAVGAVLFHALTGRPLVTTSAYPEIAQQLEALKTQPPDVAALLPGVEPAFIDVIAKAIAWDAADRYPTAAAMAEAISVGLKPVVDRRGRITVNTVARPDVVEDEPDEIEAKPAFEADAPTMVWKHSPAAGARRWSGWGGISAAAVMALVFALLWRFHQPSDPQPDMAVALAPDAEGAVTNDGHPVAARGAPAKLAGPADNSPPPAPPPKPPRRRQPPKTEPIETHPSAAGYKRTPPTKREPVETHPSAAGYKWRPR